MELYGSAQCLDCEPLAQRDIHFNLNDSDYRTDENRFKKSVVKKRCKFGENQQPMLLKDLEAFGFQAHCFPRYDFALENIGEIFERYKKCFQNGASISNGEAESLLYICKEKGDTAIHINEIIQTGDVPDSTPILIGSTKRLTRSDVKKISSSIIVTHKNQKNLIKWGIKYALAIVIIVANKAKKVDELKKYSSRSKGNLIISTQTAVASDICNLLERFAFSKVKTVCEEIYYLIERERFTLKDSSLEASFVDMQHKSKSNHSEEQSNPSVKVKKPGPGGKCRLSEIEKPTFIRKRKHRTKTNPNTAKRLETETRKESLVEYSRRTNGTLKGSVGIFTPYILDKSYLQQIDLSIKESLLEELLALYTSSNVPKIERPDIPTQTDRKVPKKVSESIFGACSAVKALGYRYDVLQVAVDVDASQEVVSSIRKLLKDMQIDTYEIVSMSIKEFSSVGAEIHIDGHAASGSLGCFATNTSTGGVKQCLLLSKHVAAYGKGREGINGKVYDTKTGRLLGYILQETVTEQGYDIAASTLKTDIGTYDTAFRNSKGRKMIRTARKRPNIKGSLRGRKVHLWGAEFRIGKSSDADMSGNNSIKDYTVDQPRELFELIATKGNDNTYEFKFRLKQTLDRESAANFNVKLIVSDGGSPIRSGTLDITVNILDENDNTPAFSSDGYNQIIDENIPTNTVILTISAVDADEGKNGQVSYRIRERQQNVDTIKRLFKLNENSGDLSVISDLTSEPLEHYEFFVEAFDHGSIALINQTVVTITVNDVENNPPTIEINLLSPDKIRYVEIEENQPTEVFVAHVNVEDYDKGDNGKFTCDIENTLFTLEKFQGRGFKIVVDGLLDREEKEMHTVTVECKDLGTPPKTSSDTFSVRVLDVNDNDPKFEKNIYTSVIAENNPIGVNITQVRAVDNDQGLNGTVEYMLLNSSGQFRINNATGHIYANKSFDREHENGSLIIFRVLAVDHGPSRRSATTTVSLTVTDTNDNVPVMIPARPEMKIAENQPPNTSLGFLQAKDSDIGVNGMVTFAITSVEQTSFPFTISRQGEIKTTEVLNREKKNRYEIPVTVTDLGVQQLSNTQYVTIYVTDENDNSPIITFPNEENNTVKFEYPVDSYNVVTTVAAYDVDDGENGSLSYKIIDGNALDIFEIDAELGEISIKKFIDIKEDMTITLIVEAKDKAVTPKSTRGILYIELIYANASMAGSGADDTGNKYIIISVVVIVTTVAVAVAIVAVILFLRSVDNKKAHEDESARYSDSGISSTVDSLPPDTYVTGTGEEKSKKKKEVSFSLEFSLDGLDGGRNTESSTDEFSQNRFYDGPQTTVQHGPPTYSLQNQDKIDGHMKALKLQQYLWEAKSRSWENSPVHQLPVGDSESETSRETITCDSGRGGSEDDVSMSSPVAEEKRFFNIQEPKPKHVHFLAQQKFVHMSLPTVRESTPDHHNHPPRPPRPVSYKPTSQTDIHSDKNNPRIAIKNFTNPTYSSNHAHNQQINQRNSFQQSEPWRQYYHQNGGKYYPRMRHDSGSSLRSNEDDGGSTTTSGSYTLDEHDIDITDIYQNQRDLVV